MTKTASASKKLTPKRIICAAALTWLVTAAVLLAIATLISLEVLAQDMWIYTYAAAVIGSAAGAMFLCSGMYQGKAVAALVNALAFFALIILFSLIAGEGGTSVETLWYDLMCVVVGSITGCILTLRKRSRRK
jgi:peptidoglycan/LPS O-acetylase OafA/YrhL